MPHRTALRRAGSATALSVAALIVSVPIGSASPKTPRPSPTFSLTVVHVGSALKLVGGFKLHGKPLKTTYRWTEQELDASGAALPLDPNAGYQFPNHSDVPLTVARGVVTGTTGASIKLRIPGANKAVLTVAASTPAGKTHKSGQQRPNPLVVKLGGYTAVGTTVPQRVIAPNFAGTFLGWDTTFSVDSDGGPTVRAPDPWLQSLDFGPIQACHWVGVTPGPPTSPLPTSDLNYAPPAVMTGLSVYPIKLVCNDGFSAIPYITVWSLPPGATVFTGGCYFTIEGVQSFTLPPTMGGQIGFFVNLLTFDPSGKITNGADLIQTPVGTRNHGPDMCQTMPGLTRFP